MVNKYNNGVVPKYNGYVTEFDKSLQDFTIEQIEKFEINMDKYVVNNALADLWQIVTRTNKYIDETSPWVFSKKKKEKKN